MADLAEEMKSVKYISLEPSYSFTSVAIETLGDIEKRSSAFLKELGHRVRHYTSKVNARLLQCFSVAVQRGNATSYGASQDWTCSLCNCVYVHSCIFLYLLLLLLFVVNVNFITIVVIITFMFIYFD